MIAYTIYEKTTGGIRRIRKSSKDFNILTEIQEDEDFISGSYDPDTFVIVDGQPTFKEKTEDSIRLARERRNSLLSASDWTQIGDAPVDAQAWVTYRQALRDVPQQVGFPDNITWPTPPKG